MKRILILVDAAADFPYPELLDRTPLETARMSTASLLAVSGACGLLRSSHRGPDASRALLAEFCGFPLAVIRDLRWGPVAARHLGLLPQPERLRFLGRFVTHTVDGGQQAVLPASPAEQEELLRGLTSALSEAAGAAIFLFSLDPGRFVLDVPISFSPTTVQGLIWDRIGFSRGLSPALRNLLAHAEVFLRDHPVNAVRLDLRENPIDGLWLWSGGSSLPPPAPSRSGCRLVSADPIALGLAAHGGWEPCPIPLEEGEGEADWPALLANAEEVILWVPACLGDDPGEKTRRLDRLDVRLLAPVISALDADEDRVLLLAAGLRHRGRPEKGPLPFVLWGRGVKPDACASWSESACLQGGLGMLRSAGLVELWRQSGD